jgi:hypothetical protein
MILRFGLSNNLINKTMCLIGYAWFMRFSEIVLWY